jgi:hypothetical protein
MRHSRMPVKISLEMYGEKPIVLPFFTGYVSRGLLLHVIRQVNPDLASLLHDADKPKPYSVTPLRFKAKKKDSKRNPIKRELEGIEKYRGVPIRIQIYHKSTEQKDLQKIYFSI